MEIFFLIVIIICAILYIFADLTNNQKDNATGSGVKRRNPNFTQEVHKRAFENLQSHNYQAALNDYNELISFNSKDTVAYFNRAGARKELGDKQGFFADLRVAENIHKQNGDLASVELIQSIIQMNTTKTVEELVQESLRRLGYDSDDEW
jgi:hypothetical protein